MTAFTYPRMPLCRKCGLTGALLAAGLALASQVQAAPTTPAEAQAEVWLAASNRTLDRQRGGFNFGAGLLVSFGISRAVYINNQLVTMTSFHLDDIAKLTAAQLAGLSQQLGPKLQVVQNGLGNTVELPAPAVAAGSDGASPQPALTVPLTTYIQNTLDNQSIRNQTVIQASSNGLGMLKSMNLQNAIRESIANAISAR